MRLLTHACAQERMSLHENLETQLEFVRQLLLGVLRVELQVEGESEVAVVEP